MSYTLLINIGILLQSIDVTDVTSLLSANKDITSTGLLLIGVFIVWKRMNSAEEKLEDIRKEKEVEFHKYISLLMENQRLLSENNRIIDENTRMFARLEKILDK